ncbi:MAG: class I SAM-dependent methyltransferase [bacterium]|nr:class I SAM-dependent methyltransferase [bacterium]
MGNATNIYRCEICDNVTANVRYKAREMMFGMYDDFTYFECGACGCLQLATPPADMGCYYPPSYYSLSGSKMARVANWLRDEYAYTKTGILGRMVFALFPKFGLQTIKQQQWPQSARILDVGCGTGAILRVLARHGYQYLHGIDPYLAQDITVSSTLRIEKRALDTMTGDWDVIMFNHSLEHISAQVETLRHACRLLAPGGVCFVRIPTASSFAWEHYRTDWVNMDAPRHYFLHSHKSINLVAAQAGFHVNAIVQESSAFQFWASEQYQRGISLMAPVSCMTNPLRSAFAWRQIRAYQVQADEMNRTNRGDEIALVLTPAAAQHS